jgi:hypothetical protein
MIAIVSVLKLSPLAGVSAGVILIAVVWGFLGVRLVPEAPDGFDCLRNELARYGRRLADGGLLVLAGSVFGTTIARTPLMDSFATALSNLDLTVAGVIITIVVVVGLCIVGMPPPAIGLVAGPVLVPACLWNLKRWQCFLWSPRHLASSSRRQVLLRPWCLL